MALSSKDLVDIRDERLFRAKGEFDIYHLNQTYVDYWQKRMDRIRLLDRIANNLWEVEDADGNTESKKALIGNVIIRDLEDTADLVGGVEPTVLVDPESESENAREKATLRQQILAAYRRHPKNNLSILRRYLAFDLAGTGAAFVVVWPDPESGFPLYIRKDPRYCLPDPSFHSPQDIANLCVSYRMKARTLDAAYPGTLRKLFSEREMAREAIPDEVDVIEFYDHEVCKKVALYRKDAKDLRGTTLAEMENKVGKLLAVMGMRPTYDNQIRGQFDEAIAPLATANRMMELHLDNLVNMIYPRTIIRGHFDNPRDFGPDSVNRTNEPANAANIEFPTPPGSNPQMFADIQVMQEQARLASSVPEARQGDISQSIASAAFVSAIQGKYQTKISGYQSVMAEMEQRANMLALAVDEKYLDFQKPISGMNQGRSFSTVYTPSRAIGGKYGNRVAYGDGSGLDALNRKVAILQDMNAGLISRRRARIDGTKVEDVQAEERQIVKEALEASILAGIALETTPLETRLQAYKMLEDGESLTKIAEELLVQPAPPEQQLGEVTQPATENLSLARGGQPGRAEELQGFAQGLPPLAELVG